ncbi:Zn-dependent hydrolase [Alkalihalobacillus sp. 1P02AB]|uniref:Zn-dependent hydrolase n=1 Tax=Alkalihalobacillus sp. 1P02AB TaxID=3132260 RepID=UPI0039A4AC42
MINGERLWNTIITLGEIGIDNQGGNSRTSLSPADLQARTYIIELMKDAGLLVRVDPIGNIIGKLEGRKTDTLMTGSHIDTVTQGGRFDGALGVLAGIEALRSLKENSVKLDYSIEVISFLDEEGTRFGTGFIGSNAMVGTLSPDFLNLTDQNGMTYQEALIKAGINPENHQKASRRFENILGFIEVHIEQGKVLEMQNLPLGIVNGIQGGVWVEVTLTSESDHAGATPMHIRKDPSIALAQIILETEQIALKYGGVATIGKVHFHPNESNIIPGKIFFTIDFRHIKKNLRDNMKQAIIKAIHCVSEKKGISVNIDISEEEEPAQCSKKIVNILKETCIDLNLSHFMMNCGAGHDAMILSKRTDIGLLLVRSKAGISHNPEEWSSKEDCIIATQVLYEALQRF